MKDKKKIGIISAIIIVLLAIILITIHSYNNIIGTYQNNDIAIDIEPKGLGYIYQENVATHVDTTLNWKKLNNNTYQIQFNNNGQQTTFNAQKKGKQLICQKGIAWNTAKLTKTRQKYNALKQKIYNQNNIQAKTLYDSNKKCVWVRLDCGDENQSNIPSGTAVIQDIVVTQNGKYKFYGDVDGMLSQILGKTPQQVINFAQSHSDEIHKWRKNKGVLFNPLNQPVAFHFKNISYTGTKIDGGATLADKDLYEYVLIYPNENKQPVPTIHF